MLLCKIVVILILLQCLPFCTFFFSTRIAFSKLPPLTSTLYSINLPPFPCKNGGGHYPSTRTYTMIDRFRCQHYQRHLTHYHCHPFVNQYHLSLLFSNLFSRSTASTFVYNSINEFFVSSSNLLVQTSTAFIFFVKDCIRLDDMYQSSS